MNTLSILTATAFANAGPLLLTAKQVAFELGVSPATLRRYAKSVPGFPTKVQLGPRRIGFERAEVERFAKHGASDARNG